MDKVKGLPPALVMAVGAMAHLHVRSRDSDFRRLDFPSLVRHQEHWRGDGPPPWNPDNPPLAIEEWLYPNGGMARPSRDWTRIRDGLQDMGKRLAYLPIPGLGDVAWLFPGGRGLRFRGRLYPPWPCGADGQVTSSQGVQASSAPSSGLQRCSPGPHS